MTNSNSIVYHLIKNTCLKNFKPGNVKNKNKPSLYYFTKKKMISIKHLRRQLIYKSKMAFRRICFEKKLRASKNCFTYKLLINSVWISIFTHTTNIPAWIHRNDVNYITMCVTHQLKLIQQMTQRSLMNIMSPFDSIASFRKKMNILT